MNKLMRALRDELGIKGIHDVLCRYKGHGIAVRERRAMACDLTCNGRAGLSTLGG